ncbi:MAG TPA: transcriptional repressor [Candidatus Obscuribacterales bacterium]
MLRKTGRYGQIQQTIASIVKGLPKGTHITAAQVYQKAVELGLDISLSTVYRNLHRLKEVGNVSTVAGDRGIRYEAAEEGPDHDHLICLGCGLTIEFVDDLIRGFGKSVAQRKGFEHTSSRFDILGYCSDCCAKDESYLSRQATDVLTSAIQVAEEAASQMKGSISLLESRKPMKAITQLDESIAKLRASLSQSEEALELLLKARSDAGQFEQHQ